MPLTFGPWASSSWGFVTVFRGQSRYRGAVLVVGVTDPATQMSRLCARDAHLSVLEASDRVLSLGDVREKGGTRRGEWPWQGRRSLERRRPRAAAQRGGLRRRRAACAEPAVVGVGVPRMPAAGADGGGLGAVVEQPAGRGMSEGAGGAEG
jgi:hypothetical protein